MNYIIYFLSLIFFIPNFLIGQAALNSVWIKQNFNNGTTGAEAWGVDIDNAGNVLWPVSEDSAGLNLNIKCYKYDSNGNELWSAPFYIEDIGNEKAFIVKATDSIIYIGGHHCPPLGFGVNCPQLLLKVNAATGVFIDSFAFKYNTSFGYNEVDDIHLFPDGIILSGWAQITGGPYETEMGFMKISHDLNTITWQNTFGQTTGGEHQDGHIVIDNNTIYACGLWGGTGVANIYDGKALLAKFDLNGAVFIDSVLFGNESPSFLNLENALGMTSDGNKLYVTGYTTPSANNGQLFVACFNFDLTTNWYVTWGNAGVESARAIEVYNGDVYVAGQSNSPGISTTGYDAMLWKFDTAGNFITYRKYETQGNDAFRDMKISSNFIYLSGASSTDTMTNKTETAFLLKCELSQLTDIRKQETFTFFSVSPNPATDVINCTFNLEAPLKFDILITDVAGRMCLKFTNLNFGPGTHTFPIVFKTHTSGIYFLKVVTEAFDNTYKIVK